MPEEIDGLKSLEAKLSGDRLSKGIDLVVKGEPVDVDLSLPKFNLESEFKLRDYLKALGMKSAFGEADFSGIDGRKNLSISNAVHKAVEVNEEGAKATVVIMRSSLPEVEQFYADRPFIFVMIEKARKSVLFMGRVISPGSTPN